MKSPGKINVLIACEESQAECLAFRERGFNAYSCDIQKARFKPEYHIMGDVTPYLDGRAWFKTQDGHRHRLSRWHLIIAHPPCTYLSRMGARHMWKNGQLNTERLELMKDAARFFFHCLNANATHVAVENPIPLARAGLPRPTCWIQHYWYGVEYTKKTLYWLRELPTLMPQIIHPNPRVYTRESRGIERSRTFPQVAQAIAQQWGDYVLENAE